ncbi:hypothetical protein HDK64DRAFT_110070 [Phyllosticta capitalensis]
MSRQKTLPPALIISHLISSALLSCCCCCYSSTSPAIDIWIYEGARDKTKPFSARARVRMPKPVLLPSVLLQEQQHDRKKGRADGRQSACRLTDRSLRARSRGFLGGVISIPVRCCCLAGYPEREKSGKKKKCGRKKSR